MQNVILYSCQSVIMPSEMSNWSPLKQSTRRRLSRAMIAGATSLVTTSSIRLKFWEMSPILKLNFSQRLWLFPRTSFTISCIVELFTRRSVERDILDMNSHTSRLQCGCCVSRYMGLQKNTSAGPPARRNKKWPAKFKKMYLIIRSKNYLQGFVSGIRLSIRGSFVISALSSPDPEDRSCK